MSSTILVAEVEPDARSLLRLYLESEEFTVLEAESGSQVLQAVREHMPDLALFNVIMPEMNGYELTKALRKFSDIPVLMLSSKGQAVDKVLGLNLGADDCISKPFNPLEVVARVKASLRRVNRQSAELLSVGELKLDMTNFRLTKSGNPISLTPMEYKILALLMRSPGRIFTKAQIYEGVCGSLFESDDNTMMVHISKLREKIEEDAKNPRYIITARGLGYKIEK